MGAIESPSPERALENAVELTNLSCWYGTHQVVEDVTLNFQKGKVCALIGPSGCGKSTLLRSINRMNDRIRDFRLEGAILVDGICIRSSALPVTNLRRKVGMVFQRPNPFPGTIYENIALAPRIHYGLKGWQLDELVEQTLERAGLWLEVKDTFRKKSAMALSGGQQQRLCIARSLAVGPEILLMDEPCSALDPTATFKIEELIRSLADDVTIVVVTHNLQQAARVSDFTTFMLDGKMIESSDTNRMFVSPLRRETEDFLNGKFG